MSAAGVFDDAFTRAAMRTASFLRWLEGDEEFVTVFVLDNVRNDYIIRQAGQIVKLGMIGAFRCHWDSSFAIVMIRNLIIAYRGSHWQYPMAAKSAIYRIDSVS